MSAVVFLHPTSFDIGKFAPILYFRGGDNVKTHLVDYHGFGDRFFTFHYLLLFVNSFVSTNYLSSAI
jgi:hypothetical protein